MLLGVWVVLLPLAAASGESLLPEPPRDKRTLHFIFKGLADAFGYDIRLKNATDGDTGLPPPLAATAATAPSLTSPRVTEATTQGYTGSTATDSELVPPFKFQGGERDDEIFDGARPTESYRPRADFIAYGRNEHDGNGGYSESKEVPRNSGEQSEQQERSNSPQGNDRISNEFSGSPDNFGNSYKSSYEGYTPTFHGNDPYYRSSSECRGCSETEEQKNDKIFINTDEHKKQISPPYTTPNWEGFWDGTASQGKDTHVGYNDYQNSPTESVEEQTEAIFPREEENFVTSKEDAHEYLKNKKAEPSHSNLRITSPQDTGNLGNKWTRPRENDTQPLSEDKSSGHLPTHEHSIHGKVYTEQIPVISTFKPKLLHALEEVEGSKQNVYVPPPFDDSFESTDSLSLTKSPKVFTTTPITDTSTFTHNIEKDSSLIDITQHYASQDKANAHVAGPISPWHPSEEHLKSKESQNKNYHYDDPHYPRPFTYTQAIFHDQPSNNRVVNTNETSTSTTPLPSTTEYLAIFVPHDTAGTQESRDVTTKLPEDYQEKFHSRISDHSSPHKSAYRYNNDYEKPIGDYGHSYLLSPAYTRDHIYQNNDSSSLAKHLAPQNSSSNSFLNHRAENNSGISSFAYSEPDRHTAHSYTPELASEKFSAPYNESSVRSHQLSNPQPYNYSHVHYSRPEDSPFGNLRDRNISQSIDQIDGVNSELVSVLKNSHEPSLQSATNSQTTKSEELFSLSPVESSTLQASDSDKYSKLETFSSETPDDNSNKNNSSGTYEQNSKPEHSVKLDSPQQGNQPNISNLSSHVSERHPLSSESPYQYRYDQPLYDYSKLSVSPAVVVYRYPYEADASYPKKESPAYVYHGESNVHSPSYTRPERVLLFSDFRNPEGYYAPSPDKVYDPYEYSEDSHRPRWEKLGGYTYSYHPQATNNTYTARIVPQHSNFESFYYPSHESYTGPRNYTFGSDYEKVPQSSQLDATTARQSQVYQSTVGEASHDGHGARGGFPSSRGRGVTISAGEVYTTAGDSKESQPGTVNATRGHLQRHPTFSADVPASSEVVYDNDAERSARTSPPSREELHYSSQTIPPPTAYQPLQSLELTKFWEQDERRPENLKVKEWESSVSTLSVMSTSTSYPETAHKKKSS